MILPANVAMTDYSIEFLGLDVGLTSVQFCFAKDYVCKAAIPKTHALLSLRMGPKTGIQHLGVARG